MPIEGHLTIFMSAMRLKCSAGFRRHAGQAIPANGIGLSISAITRFTELFVRKTPDGVTRLAEGWTGSISGLLARVRGWGQRVCDQELPRPHAGIASALLLGEDGAPLTSADWDRYVRTGVIHVLAISGQHFVVIAAFLWLILKMVGLSETHHHRHCIFAFRRTRS